MSNEEEVILRMGPWGGGVGTERDTGLLHRIISIEVYAGEVVDSIKVTYRKDAPGGGGNDEEAVDEKCTIGGTGGRSFPPIVLEEGEYVRFMSGTVVEYLGRRCVSALRFGTNYKVEQYGPYGDRRFNCSGDFSLPVESGKIVGFFGRADTHVNAIGAYVTPVNKPAAAAATDDESMNQAVHPSID